MTEAVVFDLDGTLMDTLYDLYVAVNRALEYGGMKSVDMEKVRLSVGNGVQMLVRRCMPPDGEQKFASVMERFNYEYACCKDDHTSPYAGAKTTMQKLKQSGIKIAVVSNKTESAVKALCKENFAGLYDVAVGDNGVRRLKPSPEPVEYALSVLRADKSRSFYVGDQEVDVLTAKNSGLKLIGAGWGFRGRAALEAAGAPVVCDDFDELYEIVTKNNAN